jgi:threonine/homoserine/homoserine lactone efflux protein
MLAWEGARVAHRPCRNEHDFLPRQPEWHKIERVTTQLVGFLGVSLLVIAVPGPDTALTIRNTLAGGRGTGVFTALGVATGQAMWTLATCTGLAALLLASEPAFLALKLVGAGHLVFLGAEALLGALSSAFGRSCAVAVAAPSRRRIDRRVALHQGVVSNLGNPKMAVFFPSLLPQFAAGSGTSFSALLLLGLVFCSLTLAWLAAYAVAVAKASDYLRRSGIRSAIEGVTGAVLIALGLRIATER